MFGPLKGNENKLPLVANVLPPVERLSRACHYMLKHSSGRLSSETAPLMKHRAFGAKAQQPPTRTRMVRGGFPQFQATGLGPPFQKQIAI
jgi:hypothetical protein